MRIGAKVLAQTYGVICDKFVSQRPDARKAYLVLEVAIFLSGKRIKDTPFDPGSKARLMVGVTTIQMPGDLEVYVAGRNYYTKNENKRLIFGSSTNYYRINTDGAFFYRQHKRDFKSSFFNYGEMISAISEILQSL